MALEIYMIGVVVEDVRRSVEFYRRLGLAIPPGGEDQPHVEVRMGGLTFFLNQERYHAGKDPAWTKAAGGYRIILEFSFKTREAVDAKYAQLIADGYRSHREPYDVPPGLHFAMIDDPDLNTILLSAG